MSEIDMKYRPIPFWSWNDKIDQSECRRQVRLMAEAGMGGFFIHARGGLETEYMSEEWFESVSACIDEAEKFGMDPWIYDENGWPSGAGDGKVCSYGTEFQQKKLKCEKGYAHTPYTISNLNGYHFYYEINPYYIDAMNKKAAKKFIECTYEPYYNRYGNKIKGFFTDEPQIVMGEYPWSFALTEEYKKRYNQDLSGQLYDLFFDTETSRQTRIRFWQLARDMFSENYFKQIYEWCDVRGLMFTGHLLAEESIASQIATSGSIMSHYEYFHMPGVDFLGRNRNRPLVPLQVSSAAAQLGKKQTITESYAMCGHGVSFNEMKSIAEVQMVRGVTTVCQHLQAYSMRGLRKRDFPPALFYQQPWWSDYKIFNDYIATVGRVLSEGSDMCSILFIVPMTAAWAFYDGTQNSCLNALSDKFDYTVRELEKKHIIFHLGDEKIISKYAETKAGKFRIKKQEYDTVLILEEYELDNTVKELLETFKANGGSVISPNSIESDNIVDNEEILYTKRLTPKGIVYFFVNPTDKNQQAKIIIDSRTFDYMFAPYESKIISENESHSIISHKALPLDGEWNITDFTDNSLVLDFCDCYFDGTLVQSHAYVTDIQKKACELKRPVDIRCEFYAEAEYIPDMLYLVCEIPDQCKIEVNGHIVTADDDGYFADISFRKINIAEYMKIGINRISISMHFSQRQTVYDNIEAAKFSESVKNKLSFDSEIEAIYLSGKFSVYGNMCIKPPAKTVQLEHIENQGFPFFAGKLVLEREVVLDATDYSLSFIPEGFNISEWYVNGVNAGKYLWQPYEGDISGLLKKGTNKIKLTIINNLRNLLGPHHFTGDEGRVGPSSFYKELWLWTYPQNIGWNEQYRLAEMTIKPKGDN